MPDSSEDQLARARLRVGATLSGKWRLDALLGVGGMAAVYAATHRNRKRVAIKVLRPEHSANPAMRDRFLREGYLANSVGHPAVVSVDDDDVAEDGCAFLVMELLEGEALDERLNRKGGRLPPEEVLGAADQVLEVLSVAHDKGILHRDIKPENLLLTNSGVIKVLDFGIARLRELSHSTTSTQTGSLMGTPAFMAPEQARGRWSEVDARTDLWAVGATMFFLLSGRPVHEAETANETLARVITEPAPPLQSLGLNLTNSITTLVDRALAYDKAARFQSASEMRDAVLQAYAELTGSTDAPPRLSIADQLPHRRYLPVIIQLPSGSALPSGEGPLASAVTLASPARASDPQENASAKKSRVPILTLGLLLATIVAAIAVYAPFERHKTSATDSPQNTAPLAVPAAEPTEHALSPAPRPSAATVADAAPSAESAKPPMEPAKSTRASARPGGRARPASSTAQEADPFAKRR